MLASRGYAISGGEERLAPERALKAAGGDWTILRPAWFSQNFSESPWLHEPVLAGEVVLSTGDGLEPFIDAEDIAAVAVAALTEDGHEGQTYGVQRALGREPRDFRDYVRETSATGVWDR